MVFDLPFFILGLALLWFPRRWMRLGRSIGGHSHRGQRDDEPWKRREPGDPRISFSREFAKARNYFDLLRAAAGGLAIVGSKVIAPSIAAAQPVVGRAALTVLVVQLAIMLVGLLVQTIRVERGRLTFFPAIFYLAGLSVSLCGPWSALFAFVLIWSVNAMLANAQAFLTIYGVFLCVFGLMLREAGKRLPIAALVLCLLPVLMSLMVRRPLVVMSRKAVRTDGDSS